MELFVHTLRVNKHDVCFWQLDYMYTHQVLKESTTYIFRLRGLHCEGTFHVGMIFVKGRFRQECFLWRDVSGRDFSCEKTFQAGMFLVKGLFQAEMFLVKGRFRQGCFLWKDVSGRDVSCKRTFQTGMILVRTFRLGGRSISPRTFFLPGGDRPGDVSSENVLHVLCIIFTV